jgi:hypothetical protein
MAGDRNRKYRPAPAGSRISTSLGLSAALAQQEPADRRCGSFEILVDQRSRLIPGARSGFEAGEVLQDCPSCGQNVLLIGKPRGRFRHDHRLRFRRCLWQAEKLGQERHMSRFSPPSPGLRAIGATIAELSCAVVNVSDAKLNTPIVRCDLDCADRKIILL